MSLIHFKDEIFEDIISSGINLIDFYAEWCGPCKMIGPILEELSNEITDVNIIKVNVDENNELSSKMGVMSIPTLIMFKDGIEVLRNVGFISKEEIINIINNNK